MGSEIHPTAVIDPSAEISEDVVVGPFVIIEAGVRIGPGTRLMAHAFVGKNTVMGEGNLVQEGAFGARRHVRIAGYEWTELAA